MSANQQLVEVFSRHQIFIQRYGGSILNEVLPLFDDMADAINGRIAAEPDGFSTTRIKRLTDSINQLMIDTVREAEELTVQELEELAQYEGEFTAKAVNTVMISPLFDVPTAEQLVSIVTKRPAELVVNNELKSLTVPQMFNKLAKSKNGFSRVKRAVQTGIATGQSTNEIVREVNRLVRTATRNDVEAVVRTATNHVASEARARTYRKNQRLLKGEEWVSVLDYRTSTTCFPHSTKVTPLGVTKNIMRAEYSGELITVRTATGNKLTGTASHPVLTNRGVISLAEVKPSDKLIRSDLSNLSSIIGIENVSTETSIGEIFDAFSELSVFDITRVSPSATDFYGDGEFFNGEVSVIDTDCFLSCDGEATIREDTVKRLLSFIEESVSLLGFSGLDFRLLCGLKSNMTPQLSVRSIQDSIDAGLRTVQGSGNFDGLESLREKVKNSLGIINNFVISNSSGERFSNAELCEKAGNGSGCGVVTPTDTGGRFSAPVGCDNVVSVSREFKSCHVYTLSVYGQEAYTAEGFIVKNCMSLDGNFYDFNEGPRPPQHYRCRSLRVAVIKDEYAAKGFEGDRPSNMGDQNPQTTYNSFLKRQPINVQNEILGEERAKLFRNGGLNVSKFTDDDGIVYNLQELRKREPIAFERAGL